MSYSSQLAQARFQSYLRAQNVLSDDKTPSDNAHDKDHLDEPIEHGRFQQPTGYLDTHAVEQSSMDKHLSENNIGYKLMLKMGWSKGKGLGRDGEGVYVRALYGRKIKWITNLHQGELIPFVSLTTTKALRLEWEKEKSWIPIMQKVQRRERHWRVKRLPKRLRKKDGRERYDATSASGRHFA